MVQPTTGRGSLEAGFTLIEVMMAMALLGLGLTAILSAQFSAFNGVSHARHINMAIGLARCKMTEIEDTLRVDGFQELDVDDSGICCEGDESPHISCTWTIEKPTFPEPDYGGLDLDAKLDDSSLGKLNHGTPTDASSGAGDIGDLAQQLGGDAAGDLAAGGVGGVASMVMGIVYPDLKALFEASTRRITVVLRWTEGRRPYDIELVQWYSIPQTNPLALLDDEDEDDSASSSSTSRSTGRSNTSRSPTSTRMGGRR